MHLLRDGAGEKKRGWSFLIVWGSPDTPGAHTAFMLKRHEKVHFAYYVTFKDFLISLHSLCFIFHVLAIVDIG